MADSNQHHPPAPAGSLRARLAYEPEALTFGTSGRRGKVVHLTQLEVYLNVMAELAFLQALPAAQGGVRKGDRFYYAYDLRPSSRGFDPAHQGRGGIAQAVERALRDAGMQPVNLGHIPTPALAAYALARGRGSLMITGSHIPFDRNGYKTNTAIGELLKHHEAPIQQQVERIRAKLYHQPFAESLFDAQGFFKTGREDLASEIPDGRAAYLQRYLDFFAGQSLAGRKLVVYQHSAVGRDLLVEGLERLGADVVPVGRSDTFVPIDTENLDAEQLDKILELTREVWRARGPVDAVVSTDGDSDRPLILGVEGQGCGAETTCQVRFFGGDLVGMIVAEYLGADAVVVPISCNDAVDRGPLQPFLEPKTRIGSPYVIAGMDQARRKGRQAVCGWEANGGFLTGSDLQRNGKVLKSLPTRDALLPILGVLFAAGDHHLSLGGLFARLPKRFSRAALLKQFPRALSLNILERFSPPDQTVKEAVFKAGGATLRDADQREIEGAASLVRAVEALRQSLAQFFPPRLGFGDIARLNYVDGIRIYFANGDVAHVRPSGNADELRVYAVADAQDRADAIARMGVAEPDGLLRRLAQAVAG
jgi:phosphomannomutase